MKLRTLKVAIMDSDLNLHKTKTAMILSHDSHRCWRLIYMICFIMPLSTTVKAVVPISLSSVEIVTAYMTHSSNALGHISLNGAVAAGLALEPESVLASFTCLLSRITKKRSRQI